MNAMKSVVITLPKELALSHSSGMIRDSEIIASVSENKLNSIASLLSGKTTMEGRKMIKSDQDEEEDVFFKSGSCVRGKKRRLDHLTWEEKLQRKKLKNRVAAQTSRDRKKARLDELEENVRTLKESNDALTRECAALKSQNEALLIETRRLRNERETGNTGKLTCSTCQARVGCTVSSLGSTESPLNPRQQGGTTEPASCLTLTPGATILLKILTLYLLSKNYLANSKGKITSTAWRNSPKAFCERLPQKWKEILVNQMNKGQTGGHPTGLFFVSNASFKEDTPEKCNDPKRMVGQTPKNVETNRIRRGLKTNRSWHPLDKSSNLTAETTANPLRPTPIKTHVNREQKDATDELDTMYGTYDEATNCITIVYPSDEITMGIEEPMEEVVSEDTNQNDESLYLTPKRYSSDQLSPAYTCVDSMSPSSTHSEDMDTGYSTVKTDSSASDVDSEPHTSHTSDSSTTRNNLPLTDLWNESFSELFPALA